MQDNNNISKISKMNLCTGCGTCVALCPGEAIEIFLDEKKGIYLPRVNRVLCNHCGTCLNVCPAYSMDFNELNIELFEKNPDNFWIGNYVNCYTGHALDEKIRYNATSGGFVTQFLIWALEERIIDGALVTRMNKKNPLIPEPFIARNKDELVEAAKSKYCPVPANIALKGILNSKENERFAVVGLPCHILGIRKAEKINDKLRKKIILHLGLFCTHAVTFLGTEFLLKERNIKKSDIKNISYRGEGWPGNMKIKLKDDMIIIRKEKYYDVRFGSFTLRCCTLCCDHTNILADLSFGDAWLQEFERDNLGKSIIISRSVKGDKLLHRSSSNKVVELNQMNPKKVEISQNYFYRKKNEIAARIRLFKFMHKKIPTIINKNLPEPRLKDFLMVMYREFWLYVSSKKYLWFLFDFQKNVSKLLEAIKNYTKNHFGGGVK